MISKVRQHPKFNLGKLMFAIKFSMEKQINFFWVAGFFLPAINATVFTLCSGSLTLVLNAYYTIYCSCNSLKLPKKSGSMAMHASASQQFLALGANPVSRILCTTILQLLLPLQGSFLNYDEKTVQVGCIYRKCQRYADFPS